MMRCWAELALEPCEVWLWAVRTRWKCNPVTTSKSHIAAVSSSILKLSLSLVHQGRLQNSRDALVNQ